MTNIRVENYKGLREVEIPLSRFVCLIGENNTGKSSVLQAFALFFSGSALAKTHYFDELRPIRIALTLADIADEDINLLAPEHREEIRGTVRDGTLTLVRIFGTEGKGVLKYRKLSPNDQRFAEDNVQPLLARKRPGQAFVDGVLAVFPELDGQVTTAMNQAEMRREIENLAERLPNDEKSYVDADLPSGIPQSVTAMLPDPIYIPAVKDLRDDIKTTESTPFGKVLGILLKAIEPDLTQERTLFQQLNVKLNRVVQGDGTESDDRLQPIRTIEETVQRFVQESFRNVRLRITIPPPELRTVLSSALIYANDGVDGLIDTKGDGLRRAVVFAILRSYVELRRAGVIPEGGGPGLAGSRHLLLFEEPELYLHPRAQQIFFEALGAFSTRHPVVVTTHSPAFFGPDSTTTFVKMRKVTEPALSLKPFGTAQPIDLEDIRTRDQFQIICYENNNIAFFAETVVLVEGDSDYIVLPHLARLINPAWDCAQLPVRFARTSGKGNIRRYRTFFERFGMRVLILTDLDFLLGPEFTQADLPDELKGRRDRLLRALDASIQAGDGPPEPAAADVRTAHQNRELRARWRRLHDIWPEFEAGRIPWEDVVAAGNEFFAWEKQWARRDALVDCQDAGILGLKRELLQDLRSHDLCVLEKGNLEDYYPATIVGDGKPERAQRLCNAITTREQAIPLSNGGHRGSSGEALSEFEAIFQAIFRC